MPLRTNPLKPALAQGRVQFGTWVNLVRNPAVLTLLQNSGLDYVRLDMEHSSPSVETVADMALLSRALGFPLIVRPPSASREWITRLLDLGVWGLHVPQVDTAEIARSVVEAARYAPLGMRGMSGNGPHNDYTPSNDLATLDEQTHITVMLESPRAFEELDEILSVPGIDAVTLGPTDLAQELGVFGTSQQSRVIDEHRDIMVQAAARHGKDVAMLCGSVGEARRWISAGVKMIVLSSDVSMIQQAYVNALDDLRAPM
jgi:2-keto-3-deoxy-L-rhamnonate aldolase RhmA